tara:strand:+ start:908 stop:2038 length:1131 start_codon:yes stop_codon:yes gene_type:complete
MSELRVNAIRHTSASSDAISLSSDGTCTAKITNNLSNKNLVINGAMQCAQYGTTSTTNGRGTVDRFQHLYAGTDEAPTFTQHALTSSDTGPWEKGFRYSLHATNGNQTSGAGAADEVFFYYQFEAQDIANSGWDYTSASSYITFSFWVKSSVAQNFYGSFTSRDGTQQSYPFETGSLTANTWTKITKKIPGNSNITINNDNGEGLTLGIMAFYGTDYTASGVTLDAWGTKNNTAVFPDNTSTWYTTNDATFEITGVQLTATDYCPDYPHISYGDELARCKRYYQLNQNSTGYAYNSTTCRCIISGTVDMRTGPSIAIVNGTNTIEDFGAANRNLTNLGGLSGASALGGLVDATITSSTSGKAHALSAGAISMSAEL